MKIMKLAKGLTLEYREVGTWLVFAPEGVQKGQINLNILAERQFVAPITSTAITKWIEQTKEQSDGNDL